jgi:hypothetical protein
VQIVVGVQDTTGSQRAQVTLTLLALLLAAVGADDADGAASDFQVSSALRADDRAVVWAIPLRCTQCGDGLQILSMSRGGKQQAGGQVSDQSFRSDV